MEPRHKGILLRFRPPDPHASVIHESCLGDRDDLAIRHLQNTGALETVPRLAQLDLGVFALGRGDGPQIVIGVKTKLRQFGGDVDFFIGGT